MPWDAVLGQAAAVDYLRSALRAGRAPHGYLFQGPFGVGKKTAAAALAQVLLCHQPPAADRACGKCRSCRWLAAQKNFLSDHPDLLPLLKNPGKDNEKLVGDQEQIIPLDAVQALSEKLHRTPSQGSRRVVVIPEAHRMCAGQAEAANAFLKTLEEPPPSSIVILTSSRPEALLETIVSRVQPVRFRRLAAQDILKGLAASRKPEAERELAAVLSDGSLGRAKELLDGDLGRWRSAVMKLLADFGPRGCPAFGLALWAVADSEGQRLFEVYEKGAEPAPQEEDEDAAGVEQDEAAAKTVSGWKRFVMRRLFELCEVAFRDGLVTAAGAEAGGLLQKDQADLARKLAERCGENGCGKVLEVLRECHTAVRLYVRGDLVARYLSGKMVEALKR